MRRALFALSGTVAGLVMLLTFKTQPTTVATPSAAIGTAEPGTTSGAASSSSPSSTGSAAAPSAATSTRTVTGDAAQTRYGPVQVQITVTDGTVTAVTAVDYPQNDPRDAQINAFAIPQLNQEAIAAKSPDIDIVSGATYTSQGYIESLQSALDMAGL